MFIYMGKSEDFAFVTICYRELMISFYWLSRTQIAPIHDRVFLYNTL